MEANSNARAGIRGDDTMVQRVSMGNGEIDRSRFRAIGHNVIIEDGTRIFHPENISIGDNVYIGHDCFIEGYHQGPGLVIGNNSWIGPMCYINAVGGIRIGDDVGVGPLVKMLTSFHDPKGTGPIIERALTFGRIVIKNGADIGIGAILMPGVEIDENQQIRSGDKITRSTMIKVYGRRKL